MESCRDREYGITTSGLTPLTDDISGFVDKVRSWQFIARDTRDHYLVSGA